MTFQRLIVAALFLFSCAAHGADAADAATTQAATDDTVSTIVPVIPTADGQAPPLPATTTPASPVPPPETSGAAATMNTAPSAPVAPPAAPGSATRAPAAADLSKMLFGLIVVLALMAGAVWLLKRMGMVKTGAASVGKIVGGVNVGNRERVVIVEIADQWVVVGVAPGRVTALAQLPRQERIDAKPDAAPAAPNFSDWLKQTIDKRNGNTGR